MGSLQRMYLVMSFDKNSLLMQSEAVLAENGVEAIKNMNLTPDEKYFHVFRFDYWGRYQRAQDGKIEILGDFSLESVSKAIEEKAS